MQTTNLEQEKRDDGRWLCSHSLGKVKRAEKRRCVEKGGEESEDGEDVELRDGHHFCGMEVVPMAEFVCCLKIIYMRMDFNVEKMKNRPRTASTSSGLLCWIRVSKMTMCLACKKTESDEKGRNHVG